MLRVRLELFNSKNLSLLVELLKKDKKHEQATMDDTFRIWKEYMCRAIERRAPAQYQLIECRQLVGLFQCVFVKISEYQHVKHVSSTFAKTGLAGLHGNKGGIATRLVIDDSSLCFIDCHLAAHQKEIQARNADCVSILKDATFPVVEKSTGIFSLDADGSHIQVLSLAF